MLPSAGDELRLKPGGVLIAVVAFVLTRTLLIGVVYRDSTSVLRLVPLVLGLGLVVYGVNLSVSTHDRAYARTVAGWFLVGSVGLFAMVALGAAETAASVATLTSDSVVANAVLGGGAGGILVGVRAARGRRRRRSIARQSDQVVLLNRVLRHEVLNALTAIRGHAELLSGGTRTDRSHDAIRDGADRIERTIEQVSFLVRTADEATVTLTSVDLATVVRTCSERFPDDATVAVDEPPAVSVRADGHLETVVTELVETALDSASKRDATVAFDVHETTVDVSVSAPGRWLDGADRSALLEGLHEYEDQTVDYEIPIVRLLVAQYRGTIDVVDHERRTTVVVTLPRTTDGAPESDRPGVRRGGLRNATLAGLVAGGAMGVILQSFAGTLGIVGALYGVQTVAVGWVTHLFHSVVFATVFVAVGPLKYRRTDTKGLLASAALGVLYGALLWFVGAGVVMGVWLNLVGIPSPVPNLGTVSLVGHTVWGALLGTLVFVLPDE